MKKISLRKRIIWATKFIACHVRHVLIGNNDIELVGIEQQPLFASVVRLGVHSSKEERRWQIARGVASGLSQFADPAANELIPLNNEGYGDYQHEEDLLLRQSRRPGISLPEHLT